MNISELGRNVAQQYQLQRLREQLDQTQNQINTGKRGTTFSGLDSGGTSLSINYRQAQNVLESYKTSLNMVRARTTSIDETLGNITSTARDVMTNLLSQLQSGQPQASLNTNIADSALTRVTEKLNLKIGGRYLFAGSDINNAPFASATSLNTNIGNAVTTLMAGTPSVDDVVNAASAVGGTDLGYSSTLLTAEPISVRVDDGLDLNYTVLANNQGFADITRALAMVKNLPTPSNTAEQTNYWQVVNGAIKLLTQGAKALDEQQAIIGSSTRQIDDLLSTHEEADSNLSILIGGVEDADLADAATRMQLLQTQLEASYRLTSQLRNLSLINFL